MEKKKIRRPNSAHNLKIPIGKTQQQQKKNKISKFHNYLFFSVAKQMNHTIAE